jgi:adenosylmethionine-8-amino-7-oxononanoate aminotransferase
MFAVEHDDVTPDILCLGKGITGGYLPLAATLTTEEIFSAFLAPHEEFKAFFHGHTYTGNALACAVAIANLELFENKDVLGNVNRRATQLHERLQRDVRSLAHVGEVRQRGLMVGIELVEDRRERVPYQPRQRVAHRIVLEARRHGVIVRPLGNVLILMPPLSITAAEVDLLCDVVRDSIRDVTAAIDAAEDPRESQ